jgi:hypothetical protein
MAYKNIVFIKLEKRLLNDHRWYMMSESAQLIYIKLILLAAETYNKIPKNDEVLREGLRSRQDLETFKKCLEEIKQNFPKFKENKHFRYFGEFETKTNYIPKREIPSKSPAIAQHSVDKEIEEEIDKEEEEEESKSPAIAKHSEEDKKFNYHSFKEANNPVFKDFLKKLYPSVPVEIEFNRMEGWLLTNPQKRYKNYGKFCRGWIDRASTDAQYRKAGILEPEITYEQPPMEYSEEERKKAQEKLAEMVKKVAEVKKL